MEINQQIKTNKQTKKINKTKHTTKNQGKKEEKSPATELLSPKDIKKHSVCQTQLYKMFMNHLLYSPHYQSSLRNASLHRITEWLGLKGP